MFLLLLLLQRLKLIIYQKKWQNCLLFFVKNVRQISAKQSLSSKICPIKFSQNQRFFTYRFSVKFAQKFPRISCKTGCFFRKFVSEALITMYYNTPEQRKNQILSNHGWNRTTIYIFTFCTLLHCVGHKLDWDRLPHIASCRQWLCCRYARSICGESPF